MGTHRTAEPGGARGFAFVSEKLSELLVTPVALVTERKGEGCQMCVCVWDGCFVRLPRSVSLPSQGQLGVEPSGSELNPKHLKRKDALR